MNGNLTISANERKTLSILQQQVGGYLTVEEVAEELGISDRQFYRIKARFLIEADVGLVHCTRGHGSNRGYRPAIREEVLGLHRRKYGDYGPTLFAERLEVNEGIVMESCNAYLFPKIISDVKSLYTYFPNPIAPSHQDSVFFPATGAGAIISMSDSHRPRQSGGNLTFLMS